jgi:hypothetical protein
MEPEPVFVNNYGAQESISPGWESISGLLEGSTNTTSELEAFSRFPKQSPYL